MPPPDPSILDLPRSIAIGGPAPMLRLLDGFRVPAGFPSPANDYIEEALNLNDYLIRNGPATFLFTVQGESMRGAGIVDGDKVVVDRSIDARHNHIVIAAVDGEYTIKRLFRRAGRVELRPENPAFAPIRFSDGSQLEIWGVVVGVVRRCSD